MKEQGKIGLQMPGVETHEGCISPVGRSRLGQVQAATGFAVILLDGPVRVRLRELE
jgi:hypothetical protein